MAGLAEQERELRTKRAELWEQLKPLVEKMGLGKKLSVDERQKMDNIDADLLPLDKALRAVIAEQDTKRAERDEPDTRGAGGRKSERDKKEEEAFTRFLIAGEAGLREEDRAVLTRQSNGVAEYEARLGPAGDTAPMQTTPGGQGGYLVPQGFWHNLQVALKQYGGTYPLMNQVNTSTGNQMPWPTHNPTTILAQLLTENTQVTPQDVTFGQGMLNAWTYVAGPFLASVQIVNDSAFNVDSFVRTRIGEAVGRAQAAAAWNGTGASQPLGITAAINAVGAGSVGNGGFYSAIAAHPAFTVGSNTASTELAIGALAFDTILNLITYVDPAYRNAGNTTWVMCDKDMQNQRKVSDTFGHPLWQPNVTVGGTQAGDTLYSYPVLIDNSAPPIAANTLSGPLFGSLQHGMVARNVTQAGVMRLNERYADFLAVAWLGFMRYDIRSNDLRALTQVKFAGT